MENFFELNSLEAFYAQNPDSIIFSFLAHEYIKSGNYEKAREVAEKGIRKYPNYAYGHYVLGLAHYHLNDLKKARKFLELSVAFDEKNPRAWKLIGEISESLGQSSESKESNLQYFLLDAFNKDAVETFQKEDMLQFDEFENDQTLEFESEFTGDETSGEEEETNLPEDESNIEKLFESKEEPEEIDLNRKVDEVFKETLGEMSIEREEKPLEETPFDDTFEKLEPEASEAKESGEPLLDEAFEKFDLDEKEAEPEEFEDFSFDEAFEKFDLEEEEEKEPGEPKESPFDDAFEKFDLEEEEEIEEITFSPRKEETDLTDDFDFNADFDDFYTEPGIDEEAEEGKIPLFEEEKPEEETGEEEEFDFSSILFNEPETEEPEVKEEELPRPKEEEEEKPAEISKTAKKEEDAEEELLSYRSMVDEILSEKEDESEPEIEEIAEEAPLDFPEFADLPEEEADEETPAEPPVTAKPVPPPPTASRSDGTTRFAQPPILSPTLGEIYISQGRFEEALDVFKQLLSKDPENQRFQKKIKDIQYMLDRQKSL